MILTTIGSILYALRRLSTKVDTKVTDYSLDKDMMMRLYSMNKDLNPN